MKTLKIGDKSQNALMANKMLMGHNVFQYQTLFHVQHGVFTKESAAASKKMKWWLGYKKSYCTPVFGESLHKYLLGRKAGGSALSLAMQARRIVRGFQKKEFISPIKKGHKWSKIGFPGIGTHSWIYLPNNWESDQAVDIGCQKGTPIVAVADGVIGQSFGPLPDPDPRFAGIRLHLITANDEFYYAHLSSTVPGLGPGKHVKQGALLGLSGVANGIPHLHLGQKNGNPAVTFF